MDALVSGDVFLFGPFRLDRGGGGLFGIDGHVVALGSRALDLLEFLIDHQGQLVSKQQIMDAVWSGLTVDEKNLTVQMSALRRALDSGHARPSCIQTFPGRGYRFVAAVTRVDPDRKSLIDPVTQASGVSEPSVHRHRWSSRLVALTAALILAGLGLGTAITGRMWSQEQGTSSTAPRLSIVILPFQNLGGDRGEDYLADGITDDLTTDLSHIPEAFVIARESAYTYKGKATDVRQIGRELGVRYVLEGSVQKSAPCCG